MEDFLERIETPEGTFVVSTGSIMIGLKGKGVNADIKGFHVLSFTMDEIKYNKYNKTFHVSMAVPCKAAVSLTLSLWDAYVLTKKDDVITKDGVRLWGLFKIPRRDEK